MQNRAVFRAYCLLLVFLVILFLGVSMARAWAIPEPGGIEPQPSDGWRLVIHQSDGRQQEYWLAAETPAAAEEMPGWQLNEPYVPLRLLAEKDGASLGWFEYHNGSIHTGAAVWWKDDKGVILLPGCSTVFGVSQSVGEPLVQNMPEYARPLLLQDVLCLPLQLLDALGLDYTLQAENARVDIWLSGDVTELAENETDEQYYNEEKAAQAQIKNVWQTIQPHLADFWAEELGNQLLAAAETSFNPALSGRTQNIFLAVEALHGWQAAPGTDFSFNQTVGPRTPERGFELATIFVDGEQQPGYGGGICQVSSTLYMALRQTELQILERHSHSRPVAYAPKGADATVVWNALDLRWRNNLGAPVYLLCQIEGDRLRIEVWQGNAPRELPEIFKI